MQFAVVFGFPKFPHADLIVRAFIATLSGLATILMLIMLDSLKHGLKIRAHAFLYRRL